MATAELELSSVDAAELSRQVAAASGEQLAEVMRGKLRTKILDEVFARMEQHVRPDRAAGVDAVVDWEIRGRRDGGCDRYQMVIRDGQCHVGVSQEERARVGLTLDPVSFLKLVTGSARGSSLMLRGKLKASGDIRLARSLEGLFWIPTASTEPGSDAGRAPSRAAGRASSRRNLPKALERRARASASCVGHDQGGIAHVGGRAGGDRVA